MATVLVLLLVGQSVKAKQPGHLAKPGVVLEKLATLAGAIGM
jgi:hypothetical protein